MIHLHRWTKWLYEDAVECVDWSYGNGGPLEQVTYTKRRRECTRCGLRQVRRG